MNVRRRASRVTYIRLAEETKDIEIEGGIDPDASPPMAPLRPKGIKIDLFPQQRIVLHVLRHLEVSSVQPSYLPPHIPHSKSINSLIEDIKRRKGEFYSNAWLIYLPIGCGKTLIALALIAMDRIPKRRIVIVSVDIPHAMMGSSSYEIGFFPTREPSTLARICAAPWYFTDSKPTFPSVTPSRIKMITVSEDCILPSNLFFANLQLLDQVAGYCRDQTNLRWLIIRDLNQVAKFIVKVCVDPNELKDIDIIIIPAIAYGHISITAFTKEINETNRLLDMHGSQYFKERYEGDTRVINGWHEVRAIMGRLEILRKAITSSAMSLPMCNFFTALSGSFRRKKYWARVFFDDYDTLNLPEAVPVPAISTIYISGSLYHRDGNRYSSAVRPIFSTYARRAMMISVLGDKVIRILGLKPVSRHLIKCTEGLNRSCFLLATKTLVKLIMAYENLFESRIQFASNRDLPAKYQREKHPYKKIYKDIKAAMNSDSLLTTYSLLNLFHRCGERVGLPILDSSLVVEGPPSDLTFNMLAAIMYRKVYSEIMRLNLCKIAVDILLSILSSREKPHAIKSFFSVFNNYTTAFSYPKCDRKIDEMVAHRREAEWALRDIVQTLLPSDSYEPLWTFLREENDILHREEDGSHQLIKESNLLIFLEFIAPYYVSSIARYDVLGAGQNVSVSMMRDRLERAKEYLLGFLSIVEKFIHSNTTNDLISSKCNICKKALRKPMLLSCCNSTVCYYCLETAIFIEKSVYKCAICLRQLHSDSILCSPLQFTIVNSLEELDEMFKELALWVNRVSKTGIGKKPEYILQMYSNINSFYFPFCTQTLKQVIRLSSSRTQIHSSQILLDKIGTIRLFIEKMQRIKRPIKILIYNPYNDVNTSVSAVLKDIGVTTREFSSRYNQEYRRSSEDLVILTNTVEGICGMNMEYIDAVVFMTLPSSEDAELQIIGRGQRAGRRKDHQLYVLTLFYKNELIGKNYDARDINSISIWEELRNAAAQKMMLLKARQTSKSNRPSPSASKEQPSANVKAKPMTKQGEDDLVNTIEISPTKNEPTAATVKKNEPTAATVKKNEPTAATVKKNEPTAATMNQPLPQLRRT